MFVSSEAHAASPIRFDDVKFGGGKDYHTLLAYGQAKTGSILTAVELADRLKEKGVLAYSLHPGSVYSILFASSMRNLILRLSNSHSNCGERQGRSHSVRYDPT